MNIELDLKDLIEVYQDAVKERDSTNVYSSTLLIGYRIINRLRDEVSHLQAEIANQKFATQVQKRENATLRDNYTEMQRSRDYWREMVSLVDAEALVFNQSVESPSDPSEPELPDE